METEALQKEINALIDEYRARCLWFLQKNYYPLNREDTLRVLDYIKRYGDLEAFRRASTLAEWLSTWYDGAYWAPAVSPAAG
jgi:hypothetical protein